ncbi:MAG TPA: PA14 domain-containing protein, partial [Verrucomicrobiae bacterium]
MKTKNLCLRRAIGCAFVLVLAMCANPLKAPAAALVRGELTREVYTNIFGPLISDLTNSAKFPGAPDVVGTITSFETPTDSGEMYGERLSGFLIPPVTGEYIFYLASDDQGALYLSLNHERSNLVQIATESNWSWPRNWTDIGAGRTNHENISKPIYLEAGKAYYVEGLHKEAMGGDSFGVAWQPPGSPPPVNGSEPIPGYYLGIQRQDHSPIVHVVTPVEWAVLVAGSNVQVGANVLNTDDTLIRVEFYADETLLGRAAGPFVTPAGNYLLIWSNVPPGDFALTARVIDASDIITVSPPVHVTAQAPPPGGRELHVVSVYSGKYGGGPSPNHEEGLAAVVVNRPGQKVTLCLCAYEPVLWLVTPTNGTVIERVVLSGYYIQRLQGLGPEVEILRYGFGENPGNYIWPGESLDTGRFYRTVPTIHAITGLEIGSFHGAYTAPYPVPFVIDSLQNDPRLRSEYPQPTPASELPDLNFQLSFYSGTGSGSGQVYSRSYKVSGPITGESVLPGLRVVPDAGGRYFYAAL